MYHFFVSKDQIGTGEAVIIGSDVNHIKNVLRMKPGEKILIGDGDSSDYECEITVIEDDKVTARILSRREGKSELPVRVYLFQGIPKSDKMELIIQKAVELGVYKIIPVSLKRCVVKLDTKKEETRIKRWNAISLSAAKQSERNLIPEVTSVMDLKGALSYAEGLDWKIIPYEEESGMDSFRNKLCELKPGMSAGIFIGPEGGFEPDEVSAACDKGFTPVSLGRRILRTETAGIAVLSFLMLRLEMEEREEQNGSLF